MSRVLITKHLTEFANLRKVSGSVSVRTVEITSALARATRGRAE